MGLSTQATGFRVTCTAKASTSTQTAISMRVPGKKTESTAKAYSDTQTAMSTKALLKRISRRGKEP